MFANGFANGPSVTITMTNMNVSGITAVKVNAILLSASVMEHGGQQCNVQWSTAWVYVQNILSARVLMVQDGGLVYAFYESSVTMINLAIRDVSARVSPFPSW